MERVRLIIPVDIPANRTSGEWQRLDLIAAAGRADHSGGDGGIAVVDPVSCCGA
jgi:hypothetical protein